MNYDDDSPTTYHQPLLPQPLRPTTNQSYVRQSFATILRSLCRLLSPGSQPRTRAIILQAREALDRWVREVVAWHFDPATGSPFWLERARTLGWDPRERITSFADLKHFGGFEDEWLRGGPVQRWVPKGCAGKPVLRVRDRRHDGRPQDPHQLRGLPDRLRGLQHHLSGRTLSEGRELADAGPVRSAASAARGRAPVPAPWRHLLLRGSRSPMGHQVDQEGMERALERLQGSRHRSGGDHPQAGHDIKCMFTTPKLLESLALRLESMGTSIGKVGHQGHLLRRHGIHAAVEPLRA